MTTPPLAGHPAASQQAIVDAALLMLRQMGLPPDDLAAGPEDRPPVPACAGYVPAVSAAVTDGTRRAYGSYWNRVTGHWGERRLDETEVLSATFRRVACARIAPGQGPHARWGLSRWGLR